MVAEDFYEPFYYCFNSSVAILYFIEVCNKMGHRIVLYIEMLCWRECHVQRKEIAYAG